MIVIVIIKINNKDQKLNKIKCTYIKIKISTIYWAQ